MVSPGIFIPIAESVGLIDDLGQWMLRESCQQAKLWLDEGWDGQISVNVSVAQIRKVDFEREVEAVLKETNLPACRLCLELTGSLFAGGSPQKLKRVLEALKALGVGLAIDDFGTGYSSLSYLRGFPFDKLKIDRAFVHGIENDAGQRHLLTGIVEFAHALDLRTVAEGAETAGEVALLMEIRVDEIQGYYFSRPLAAGEAMKAAHELNCNRRHPAVPSYEKRRAMAAQ
jgi:EAL domain-containing protein (putative c-di-GMP-specific phosphodiesterase class I)